MRLLHHSDPIPNFGDDINEQIWDALAPGMLDDCNGVGFLGIGTVVGKRFDPVDELHIFSSGAGYDPIDLPSENVNVWCVRGPITAGLLNVDPSRVVTDGALLAPLVWPAAKKKQQVVVMPHWQSLHGREAYWERACSAAGFKLVSPMQRVEKVLTELSSATLVLTESLHGAILADAYGVPWKAWACSSNFSLIKWKDWTASMDLPLSVSGVAAPSTRIVKDYGRSLFEPGSIDVPVSDDVVEREIYTRCSVRAQNQNVISSLKSFVKRTLLSEFIGSNILGYRPEQTAKQLLEIARTADRQLSAEDHRARLTQKLLHLLNEVANSGSDNNLHLGALRESNR